jgi:hypothetical protein
MGSGLVRLGAVPALACRAGRIVNFYESFGLGVGHRGPYAARWTQAGALSQPLPPPLIRDLLSSCLAAAASAGPSAAG